MLMTAVVTVKVLASISPLVLLVLQTKYISGFPGSIPLSNRFKAMKLVRFLLQQLCCMPDIKPTYFHRIVIAGTTCVTIAFGPLMNA